MGEVVLYQPDERTQLEVRLEDETVWLTQQQMSELFDVKEHTITYHIKEIYKSQELDAVSTARKIRVVRKEGNRQVNRQLDFYNLDMILSVGYRVNSVRGIMFRRWSSGVLKQYLLRGYAVHEQIQQLENRIDNRFVALQQYTDKQMFAVQQQISDHQQQIDFLVHTHQQPTYQLYDNGCVFDAWAYVSDLVRNATQRIILIDNYVDDRVLSIMQKRTDGVSCTIHTRYTEQFKTDLEKHNEQYPAIQYVQLPQRKHDRYLIVDDVVYMLGGSLKDMGKSLCGIIRTEMQPEEILTKLN